MKCLKCQEVDKTQTSKITLNKHLAHLANWYVCDKCDDTGKYAHEYYQKNKEHYRKLHVGYKTKLSDSYVANCVADGTSLKGKDIPKPLVQAKRQYMKMNREIKEIENG
tara:strand:- start:278 stop:604 length:327 start_codon:yes stop_codon:yes gene_type:complete